MSMSYGVGLSLRSARTVLEKTIVTTVSTVVQTGVPYTSELLEAVIALGQRTDREKTGQGVLRQRDPTGADHSKESRLRRKVVHEEHRLRARRNAS